MKKKKIIINLLILFICLFVTGCGKEEVLEEKIPVGVRDTVLDDIDASGTGKLFCTREAYASQGIDVELTYELEYRDGNVILLHSNEKVISEDSDSLDEYEDAYRNIAKYYKGLKYYDITITRDKTSVTNDTLINYGKIDTSKLLAIEGEEDNVIVDGKVKLETWVKFAEQFGTSCEEVK